jgi:NADPH-dependent glutamate synthase beta subunit-like oxidoreductase
MDIPRMIRQIAAGRLDEAIATVKADIALPAVLGRICPAPCEKGCRRSSLDSPVSICLLKRHVADADLAADQPFMPAPAAPSGKRVAVVGAGPTGLAAAYYLLAAGHECEIYDDMPQPGGQLRIGVSEAALDRGVLDKEIDVIRRMGAVFRQAVRVGADLSLADLRRDSAAVLLAIGATDQQAAAALGLDWTAAGLRYDHATHATSIDGVFAACSARQQKMAVRAVADGKSAAGAIGQYLAGCVVTAAARPFSVHIGRVDSDEARRMLGGASQAPRIEPAATEGFSAA